jgi:hypothetical protein
VLAARVPALKARRAVEELRSPRDGAASGRRRPLSTAPGPRRVSGPTGGRSEATPRQGLAASRRGVAPRLGAALGSMPRLSPAALRLAWLRFVQGRSVERLSGLSVARGLRAAVLGRTWIAVVAFALIGIVTLQLGLLKLNASIGRGLEHEALLQRQNAELSIEDSEMGASASVQSRAARMGMELVPPGLLRFLSVRGFDAGNAAGVLSAPIGSSANGSSETPGSAPQGQSGASSPASGASSSSTEPSPEPSASEASTAASPGGSPGTAASGPDASGTTTSAPPTAAAPEEPRATPVEPTAASSPAGTPSAGVPAAGGSGEAQPAGGTQSAGPGG